MDAGLFAAESHPREGSDSHFEDGVEKPGGRNVHVRFDGASRAGKDVEFGEIAAGWR